MRIHEDNKQALIQAETQNMMAKY